MIYHDFYHVFFTMIDTLTFTRDEFDDIYLDNLPHLRVVMCTYSLAF